MVHHLKAAAPKRPADRADVAERVRAIVEAVRTRGDAAVREVSATFDRWEPASFRLDE